ncbi:MAG: hypothetical protein IT578_08210 [Verrucomicrobiae bacterium]|nr:hypothetical protein [Verrucomicrobiae bacterium]
MRIDPEQGATRKTPPSFAARRERGRPAPLFAFRPSTLDPCATQRGQALAELTIGLIVFAVLFLGVLTVGNLGRARLAAILEARAAVGLSALQGYLFGEATYFGASAEDLQRSVLSVAEDPIAYSQYRPGAYPYMQNNLVAPLQGGTLIGAFVLTQDDASRAVTNYEFLVRMGVGSSFITVRQPVALPVLRGFP